MAKKAQAKKLVEELLEQFNLLQGVANKIHVEGNKLIIYVSDHPDPARFRILHAILSLVQRLLVIPKNKTTVTFTECAVSKTSHHLLHDGKKTYHEIDIVFEY